MKSLPLRRSELSNNRDGGFYALMWCRHSNDFVYRVPAGFVEGHIRTCHHPLLWLISTTFAATMFLATG